MPLFLIALGVLVVYCAPGMARENNAFFRHAFRLPVPLPKVWVTFFRVGGMLLILTGIAMLFTAGAGDR